MKKIDKLATSSKKTSATATVAASKKKLATTTPQAKAKPTTGKPTRGARGVSSTALKAFKLVIAKPSRPSVGTGSEIVHLAEPRRFRRRPQIHPRRIIPEVPLGDPAADSKPTQALRMVAPAVLNQVAGAGPGILANTDTIVVKTTVLNDLATNDTASHVCEPSVASNGDVVVYTGNWFAAVSTNGGTTFQYVDPFTAFPDPPGMEFCCDQVVHYIKKIDTFVWLLQYGSDATGANIQRLAFARTSDVKTGNWRTFDITPQMLGLGNTFLDFPDLAVGSNMLYMTTNAFNGQNWIATAVVRVPLAGIKSGSPTAQAVKSTTNFNFRIAQNCGNTAYWASHQNTSTLRVYAWPESAAQATFTDVTVAHWATGPYSAKTPDGHNWLGRLDPRLVGATKAGSELWFAWTANKGGANSRPNPYVQIARLKTSGTLIENINIWDAASAVAYGALSTNSNREVGMSYAIGGSGKFPSHAVAVLTGVPRHVTVTTGQRGPSDNKWGDYLTVRRHYPKMKLFSATGYTLQQNSGSADATPQYVLFGRSSDV